ncbi:hypothetical protein ACQU0X_27270 [Pseudovibrio ascidiaceicola]|uniref:hypothetical protein n=1 Tax=Pseudovibrio ascidiaceicola TaxID=285279 RepID=UPI003D36FEB6
MQLSNNASKCNHPLGLLGVAALSISVVIASSTMSFGQQTPSFSDGATLDGSQQLMQVQIEAAEEELQKFIGTIKKNAANGTVTERDEVVRQNQFLEEILTQAKLISDIRKQLYSINNKDETIAKLETQVKELSAALAVAQQIPKEESDEEEETPVVSYISGSSGKLQAVLLIPYRGQVLVHEGIKLSNGMVVEEISSSQVLVKDEDGERLLPFASSVPMVREAKQ